MPTNLSDPEPTTAGHDGATTTRDDHQDATTGRDDRPLRRGGIYEAAWPKPEEPADHVCVPRPLPRITVTLTFDYDPDRLGGDEIAREAMAALVAATEGDRGFWPRTATAAGGRRRWLPPCDDCGDLQPYWDR